MTFSELPSSGAAQNQVSRPLSSHFFLQISAPSMQDGDRVGGTPHTPRPLGSDSHKSLLPAQVTLGFAPRPRLTPPPRARPGYQHIPLAARRDADRA